MLVGTITPFSQLQQVRTEAAENNARSGQLFGRPMTAGSGRSSGCCQRADRPTSSADGAGRQEKSRSAGLAGRW